MHKGQKSKLWDIGYKNKFIKRQKNIDLKIRDYYILNVTIALRNIVPIKKGLKAAPPANSPENYL